MIEDYRKSSAFDILGSIGGLLALLQGIHIFLFGRPLFWGIFGAKLLTPFGIVGQFANRGFRQRLHDYYHVPEAQENPPDNDVSSAIRMNRFLLDYVLDMGPAAATPPTNPRDGNVYPAQPNVGPPDMQELHGHNGLPGDVYAQIPLLTANQPSSDQTPPVIDVSGATEPSDKQ
ncbi:hypothetical protein FRC08_008419 [Ceratobasidium sp. 394]|nr:hypothetical protein FRC08_008419 [Ceratobasidium sp. 394]KAG9091451.1 hypothetical protein FS749_016535 [Ceratobasidium sp. UAMH 11750]